MRWGWAALGWMFGCCADIGQHIVDRLIRWEITAKDRARDLYLKVVKRRS